MSDYLGADLWVHQRKEVLEHALDPARALLWEPRVGKTRTSLGHMDAWLTQGITRVLIAAPQTVCDTVWFPDCIAAFYAINGKNKAEVVNLYEDTIATRKAALRALQKRTEPVIIIVNRDALHALVTELVKWGPQGFILDEVHDYKTPSSYRHLAARRIAAVSYFRRGLTGTPTPKSYADLYGEYRILAPEIYGTRYDEFKARYCIMHHKYHSQVVSYVNTDELKFKMNQIASVVNRKDCFDMPDVQEVVRRVHLPKNIKNLYDTIAKEHVIEGSDQKLDHALARLTLLQQLAGGYLPNHMDDSIDWKHDAKIDCAVDEIEDIVASGKKVVVFYRFIAEGERLLQKLGPKKAALMSGKTKPSERTGYIHGINSGALQVLIVQEAVGSVGISLAGADYCIFLSTGFSYATHTQARDRIFKPGGKLVYIYIQAVGTVDAGVRRIIRNKQSMSDLLLGKGFNAIASGEFDE